MGRRNYRFANWDGPSYVEGKHVACTSCEGSGVGEYMEHPNGDESFCAPCDHCDGTGCEPWRAAGSRDTSRPPQDSLSRLQWCRKQLTRRDHATAVRQTIGPPVLIELSVEESFAMAHAPTLAELYSVGERPRRRAAWSR
ncbi:MAG: hypothetical protein KA763_00460 [Xanthomonadales bacterium]|nr:hypothetical protein [Xanthomonadales bacterium]